MYSVFSVFNLFLSIDKQSTLGVEAMIATSLIQICLASLNYEQQIYKIDY